MEAVQTTTCWRSSVHDHILSLKGKMEECMNENVVLVIVEVYPNYTLPPANLSFPTGPSSPPNYTLIILPTSSSSLDSVPRTACALSNVRARDVLHMGARESEGLWLRDLSGWRWQWLINGLTPATNYTVFAMQDRKKVSSPSNFVTKSGMFLFTPYLLRQ